MTMAEFPGQIDDQKIFTHVFDTRIKKGFE